MDNVYITKQESAVLKGMLILLIIWGHCHFLNGVGNVYHFHLPVFFILPFFYNRKMELSVANVKKHAWACIVPYTWFYIICCIVSFAMKGNRWEWWEYLAGYFNTPGYDVGAVCGFIFPWFLLCYFICGMYRMIVSRYKWVMMLCAVIGLLCFYDYNYLAWNVLFKYDVLMLNKAAYYFFLGTVSVLMHRYIPYWRYIGSLIFVAIMILSFCGITVLYFLYGLCGFSFFWTLAKLFTKSRMLTFLGNNSIYIYLTHVFVVNLLEKLLPNSFVSGILVFFVATLFTMFLSVLIGRMSWVQHWVFGRRSVNKSI